MAEKDNTSSTSADAARLKEEKRKLALKFLDSLLKAEIFQIFAFFFYIILGYDNNGSVFYL